MSLILHRFGVGVLAVAVAPLLASCGFTTGSPSGPGPTHGPVRVVAATNVWGDIARQVGGRWVRVRSVIANPNQDPHSFEANAQTALAVSKARLVVVNGGGYDPFMRRLLASYNPHAAVVDAVAVSGKARAGLARLNEHVWYDFTTVRKVADRIAARLAALAPRHAHAFRARARALDHRIAALAGREHALRDRFDGDRIGITEPVPLYLTAACGLGNRTPPAFSEAVEEGRDVAPSVLAQTLEEYRQHRVRALVYNAQTADPLTQQVRAAATAAGIPVVPVTETLPPGQTYLTWMRGNLTRLQAALSKEPR